MSQLKNSRNSGYYIIKEMLANATDFKELKIAAEKSIELMNEYKLDAVQRQTLEEFGIKQYGRIERKKQMLESMCSHNRFKS